MRFTRLSFIILTSILVSSCSSTRLIVKSDKGKAVIKESMSVAVTMKGEHYSYNEDCKSICKECDPLLHHSLWKVDSIMNNYVVLRRDLEFMYDTIPQSAFKNFSRHDKKTNLEIVIIMNKKAAYVYKIPTKSEFEKIAYDSLNALTFSYKDKCYHAGPLQKMFANPNKIRRAWFQGADVQVKH